MSTSEREIIDDLSIVIACLSIQYDIMRREPDMLHSAKVGNSINLEKLVRYVFLSFVEDIKLALD